MADTSPTDPAAVQARYAEERARRLEAGTREALAIGGAFSRLLDDPHADRLQRAPVQDEVDVLVVGGGFGGLLTAARLLEAGVERVCVVEAGADFGGTWYWNRYPGAACDVESYIYLPLLEETGYMPVERYSKAAEIRAHCRRIAERYGLYERALLSTQATALGWDAAGARWQVATDRGDALQARFVVLTTGPLNRPKLPAIPGFDRFAGHSFHTSRWNYAYTGGSATEPMTGLADKSVGIVGTGATAIQCVPPLARDAAHLSVFQRTPSSVDARGNAPTDPDWVGTLRPGWQQRRMESFTHQMAGNIGVEDLVGDGWTVLARAIREKIAANPSLAADPAALLAQADAEKMMQIRERIDRLVHDGATAEALKPWFSLFCKRPCFHDEYLQSFNRPNVTLVDTQGRGIEEITPDGVVAGGIHQRLDCLIFATGFETATDYARRSGFAVRGVDGRTLSDKWAGGVMTLHGMHSRAFPNCFVLSHVQSGMAVNFPHMISEQAIHVAHIVRACRDRGITTVEASEAAEAAWTETIVTETVGRRRFLEQCTPGYYNNEGRMTDAVARSASYGGGPVKFIDLLRAWREAGDLAGLELDGTHARTVEEAHA